MSDILQVCLGSYYLSFVFYIFIKNSLIFLAIKYSEGNYSQMMLLMLIFDATFFSSLILLIMLTSKVC